jgi:hypothetical protein
MSRQGVKRCRAWGVFGATLALSAAVLAWDAGRSPAAACATTPCNTLPPVFPELSNVRSDTLTKMDSNYSDGVSFEDPGDFARFMQTGQIGNSASAAAAAAGHLGMYVNGSPDLTSWGVNGGGAVLHSDGFRMTDSAGAFTPGTLGPSTRDVSGGGGINGTFDATRFFGLPTGQSLTLKGFFEYDNDDAQFGLAPGVGALAVGNGGSINSDNYTFGATALYTFGTSYLGGMGTYSFGHANETNTVTTSTGTYSTSGYSVDARLGHVFTLMNTSGSTNPGTMPTKAPPKPVSGTFVGLDLSAHIGDFEGRNDGFIDSTAFIFGSAESQFGDIGGRARLVAVTSSSGVVWMPYISGTVDQNFSVSNVQNIPNQVAFAGGDVVTATTAKTFWGTDFGVSALTPGGWSLGVKGFYETSSDTNIIGGMVSLKIPFNYAPTVAARY